MADLINRQDAIDKLRHMGYMDEHNEVEEALMRLPSVEPKQQWIPVTERLPEKSGRYLVTRGLNAAGAIWNRVYIVNYSDLMGLKDNRIFWQGNVGKSDFEKLEDVLAWLPLPETYRQDGGE